MISRDEKPKYNESILNFSMDISAFQIIIQPISGFHA